jgi:NTP pyrophosphatase (non-canonical NTP hydrolase)
MPKKTTNFDIQVLQNNVKKFCEDRDWDQFHNAKDLAIGISTEANELLDLFRFKSNKEVLNKFKNKKDKTDIENELADVFFFVLRFAQMNNIDLAEALNTKMKISEKKYPVAKSKGSNKKYTEL